MYEGDAEPDASAIAAFGLRLEGYEPAATECWPDTWQTLQVFAALGTQWNVGASGSVIGLRYEAVEPVVRMMGVARAERMQVFADLRTMENEALDIFNHGR